jgi:hypothetical protein
MQRLSKEFLNETVDTIYLVLMNERQTAGNPVEAR